IDKMSKQQSSRSLIKNVKRKTRKLFSTEEKIRIVIDGLRGEVSIAELDILFFFRKLYKLGKSYFPNNIISDKCYSFLCRVKALEHITSNSICCTF
ncbi:MAG: hypothetical protein OIF50_10155, partial [Flavobacteriaceae bacterium]|nr:hypothetical protein [Flavobacteriaceae bacterium]